MLLCEILQTEPAVAFPITAADVVKQIIGPRATTDADNTTKYSYLISKPWYGSGPMFDTFDSTTGGVIALPRPNSKRIKDIAGAAHEAFHAWLHMNGQDWTDERQVNKLAAQWLTSHYKQFGFLLHSALEEILRSKISYKHN